MGVKLKIGVGVKSQKPTARRDGSHFRRRLDRQLTIWCSSRLVARRTPMGLALEKAGFKPDAKGFLSVDPQRRTNVPHIYAIGDIAGQPLLAHKGSKEGIVAAEVIAGMKTIYDVVAMPAVIFTDPEIATVGLTEAEAKAKGYRNQSGDVSDGRQRARAFGQRARWLREDDRRWQDGAPARACTSWVPRLPT